MKPFIYMLEDDQDDRSLTREYMDSLSIDIPVHYFSHSTELEKALAQDPLPSLILVDYNCLPENGVTVCRNIKSQAHTAQIPVVLLSDGQDNSWKEAAYRSGANSFIRKPATLEETEKKIGTFFTYWMEVAEL